MNIIIFRVSYRLLYCHCVYTEVDFKILERLYFSRGKSIQNVKFSMGSLSMPTLLMVWTASSLLWENVKGMMLYIHVLVQSPFKTSIYHLPGGFLFQAGLKGFALEVFKDFKLFKWHLWLDIFKLSIYPFLFLFSFQFVTFHSRWFNQFPRPKVSFKCSNKLKIYPPFLSDNCTL